MLAGVCGGIASYLNTDSTPIRIIWAILSTPMFGFIGLPVYLLCWAIIPPEPASV